MLLTDNEITLVFALLMAVLLVIYTWIDIRTKR